MFSIIVSANVIGKYQGLNSKLNDDLGLRFVATFYSRRRVSMKLFLCLLLPHRQIKYPVDFDDELKVGDVRYDNMTKITIKQQLF